MELTNERAVREVGGRRAGYRAIKRAFDLFAATTGIILLSPLMVVIALAVRLTSKGPALYRQVRVGKNGRLFTFYKFRSMYQNQSDDLHREAFRRFFHGAPVDVDSDEIFKLHSDPRITRVGRLLRRSSLDELPQLLNVVHGDMSLVGPRPPIPYEVEHYSPMHVRRLSVTPGLTGLWQVKGRSRVSFEEMVALDLEYIDRSSTLMDLKILLATIPVLMTRQGGG
jgi:lipopolysaccharide/colanic/teichoic acid biosynthesis glycosyltransferase